MTPGTRERKRLAEDYRRRLEALRPAYERARAEWGQPGRDNEDVLADLASLLGQFQPGDGGDKAIFLLGQASQVVARVSRRIAVIREYEGLRDRLGRLERGLEEPPGGADG
ncbi:MAG TPA: hypothetical protein VNP94_02450 [Actinomycetota bacterium]|nr:hypothetical protein [Actinomycetota bacterium]